MADAVPGRADGGHARRHVPIPGIARDLAAERVEDAPVVVEQLGHTAFGGAAHFAVIHPEDPFLLRHHDLGIRKRRRLVVGREQAVHVVAMKMRDHHDVDGVAVEAGRRKVVLQPPALALGLREHRLAVAGVDQHAFAAGLDQDRRIDVPHVVGRKPRLGERGQQLILARIDDVAVR